jgi:hypothetical protein
MLPGLTERTGSGIACVYDAATAWFLQHWIQRIGREPCAHDLEPITRAYWESGRRVSAADYLQAVEELQRFSRAGTVAHPAVVANITGSPAMSVPLWWSTAGLPIGVHFLGRFGDEVTLFQLTSQLEAARPWQSRVPAFSARDLATEMAEDTVFENTSPAPDGTRLEGIAAMRTFFTELFETNPGTRFDIEFTSAVWRSSASAKDRSRRPTVM